MTEFDNACPVCGTALRPAGPRYELERIRARWRPIVFSAFTREEHARQRAHTQLYCCPE
jgi:hypothetical protein